MIASNVKIAFRIFQHQKLYSFVNLIGLTVGIVCGILVVLYVQFEISYDNYHKDVDRIFRVCKSRQSQSQLDLFAPNVLPIAPILKEKYPEIEKAARIGTTGNHKIKYNDLLYIEEKIFFADNEFFEIFNIPFIIGNPETALSKPNSLVITESISEKLFGNEYPVGKVILLDTLKYEITSVVEDCPENSHINFSMLGPTIDVIAELRRFNLDPWNSWHAWSYIKLSKNSNPNDLEEKIKWMPHEYIGEKLKVEEGTEFTLFLQPIEDIHLYSKLKWEASPSGSVINLYIISLIGLFILIIACMNFVNLSTARYSNRIREIGVRKVLGAERKQLIFQFMNETFITVIISLFFSILLVVLILPYLNDLVQVKFSVVSLLRLPIVISILCILSLVVLVSGIYPAVFLSSFQPASIIKGSLGNRIRNTWIRKGLVVIQFSISIMLIVGTFIFYNQLAFMQNQNLGFDKNQKLIIEFNDELIDVNQYESIKSEFLKYPAVEGVTFSSSIPGRNVYQWPMFPYGEKETNSQVISSLQADFDFVKNYNISLEAGRDFDKKLSSEIPISALLLNEEAIKALGWNSPEEALNKYLYEEKFPVVGVIKNFNYYGLQKKIEPLAIFLIRSDFRYLTLNINTKNINETLANIEGIFKRLWPDEIYIYTFLDEDFENQYETEGRLSKSFGVLSLGGIFIACLGLFGLASFIAEKRKKEVGIRKVLGASTFKIVRILCFDFLKWVLLSNVIAWPVAYYLLESWLRNFAYRIELNLFAFILSGLIAFIIALLSVSYQSYKSASYNPVDSLKYE